MRRETGVKILGYDVIETDELPELKIVLGTVRALWYAPDSCATTDAIFLMSTEETWTQG